MNTLPTLDLDAAAAMWRDYRAAVVEREPVEPPHVVECFGDNPRLADELLNEVMQGTKRATSSLANEYVHYGEKEPQTGDHWVVCDGSGAPRIILKVASVERSSFFEVSAEFAAAEGEGDRSLEHWRAEHEKYWKRTQRAIGREWSPEQTVNPGEELILERLQICWPPELADQ